MSKPEWKYAPEWAQWMAQDEDGDWYWYENSPKKIGDSWVENSKDGRVERARISFQGWAGTLEKRP